MKETVISAINLGLSSNKSCISVYMSLKNKRLCRYLFKCGLIDSFFLNKKNNAIIIYLVRFYDKKAISYIKKVSRPGGRKFATSLQLKKMLFYRNTYIILSTDKGFLNNRDAVSKSLGGELLFIV